jgi:hypothetical protein
MAEPPSAGACYGMHLHRVCSTTFAHAARSTYEMRTLPLGLHLPPADRQSQCHTQQRLWDVCQQPCNLDVQTSIKSVDEQTVQASHACQHTGGAS